MLTTWKSFYKETLNKQGNDKAVLITLSNGDQTLHALK